MEIKSVMILKNVEILVPVGAICWSTRKKKMVDANKTKFYLKDVNNLSIVLASSSSSYESIDDIIHHYEQQQSQLEKSSPPTPLPIQSNFNFKNTEISVSNCQPLDYSIFTDIRCGDLEGNWHLGWNAMMPRNESNTAYISIALNDMEVARLKATDPNLSTTQYQLQSFDFTQYANGEQYILTFRFMDFAFNIMGIFLVDYITIVSLPSTTINNDLYISLNGSDITGNGSISSPFCSLQHAINSISSGHSIYLLDNNVITPVLNTTYAVDTLSKRLTIQSYVKNPPGKGSLITVAPNCKVEMDSCQITGVNSIVSKWPAVITFASSSLVVQNLSLTISKVAPVFMFYGQSASFYNSNFRNMPFAFIFVLEGKNLVFTIDNCVFDSNFNIVNGTYFNEVWITNSLVNNLRSQQPDIYSYGEAVIIRNTTFQNSQLAIKFENVQLVLIDGVTFNFLQMLFQSAILLANNGATNIQNSQFINSQNSIKPFITVSMLGQLTLTNNTFNYNQCQFISTLQSTNISITNLVMQENQLGVSLIQLQTAYIRLNNVSFIENSASLISAWLTNIAFENSNIQDNQNSGILPTGLIQLYQPTYVSFSYLDFTSNLNFILVQIINATEYAGGPNNVLLSTLTFNQNYIGTLLYIEGSNVTTTNLQFYKNFMVNYYPMYIANSFLSMTGTHFTQNFQSLYIVSSNFTISETGWEQISFGDNKEFSMINIENSNGEVSNSYFSDSSPSGFQITDSTVVFNNVDFSYLYGFHSPLGDYLRSDVVFANCYFDHISSGDVMMMITLSNVTFSSGSMFNLSSPSNSIMTAESSSITLNATWITSTRSNGKGFDLHDSHLSLINTQFKENQYLIESMLSMTGGSFVGDNILFSDNQGSFEFYKAKVSFANSLYIHNFQDKPLIQANRSIVELDSTSFLDNGTPNTQSLISTGTTNLVINNCMFNNYNITSILPSVIYFYMGTLQIVGSDMSEFSVAQSLLVLEQSDFIDIDLSRFTYNNGISGSCIYARKSKISLTNSDFESNAASIVEYIKDGEVDNSRMGGVMYLVESHLFSNANKFNNNYAVRAGGVMRLQNSVAFVWGSQFNGNFVGYGAGAICFSDQASCYLGNCTDNFKCNDGPNDYGNSFSSNLATNGYGIYSATGPKTLNITMDETIHPNTSFTILIAEYDAYGQVVTLLPEKIFMYLTVYMPSGEIWTYNSFQNSLQGFFTVQMTPNEAANSTILFVATSTNQLSGTTNKTLTICNPGSFPSVNDYSCQLCPLGSYGYDGKTCISCKDYQSKLICPGGNAFSVSRGWWLLPNVNPPSLYVCDPNICYQNQQCRLHQRGTLCSSCESGYSKVKTFCEDCMIDTVNLYMLSGLIVFLVLYIFCNSIFKYPSSTVIMNFLVAIQIIGIISYNVRYIFIVPLFDFMVDYWPTACFVQLNYLWKSLMSLVIMLIIVAISSNINIGKELATKIFAKYQGFFLERTLKNNQFLYSVLSNLLILYTPFAFLSIGLVSCQNIGGNSVLILDASVHCFDKHHLPALILSIFILVFVVTGIPLFIIFKLYKRDIMFIKVFCLKYRTAYFWWDLVIIFRSLCFVLATIFTFNYLDTKGLMLSSFAVFFSCVNWLCSPYRVKSHNDFETHVGLVLCLSCLIFNSRVLDNSSQLAGIIISVVASFCFVSLVYYIYVNAKRVNKNHDYEEIK
ncbi:hypothetical protein PPL_06999 [Heterostelium album PN500]|uniref:Right handed beta helix domain-containing protein n=1 Tax=Heterostelium pallidum (strain ATCC 26659 / Pp 5 / PN500) TaxID=670386 RepID=D3BE46_HETP5|nr:hypothetical protein PPL_06999 [Heterostelium album PN500]EFA80177.1 hypothetical protein PPL_06999 [Heterostelium album PN500]|eukprot:XP_020432297.1 hypothetical protein PPL_06999 [Heterostelium album PN500]